MKEAFFDRNAKDFRHHTLYTMRLTLRVQQMGTLPKIY